MQRILILSVTGGGGHDAVAGALVSAFAQLDESIRVTKVDPSKASPIGALRHLDTFYRWMALRHRSLYRALWATDGLPWLPGLMTPLLAPLYRRALARIYEQEQPDAVISVHSVTNHIPLYVLLRGPYRHVPFVSVVTELVLAHPTWFAPEATCCCVATELAQERALRFGMPPEKVEVTGLPIRPDLAHPAAGRAALRAQLGLNPSPCILIVGGGDGVGPVLEAARALDAALDGAQLIVVAGRNEKLEQALRRTAWRGSVHVHGFVDNMPSLMHASDLLITKAGSVTLAEAFAAGLPIVLLDVIPGQEEGNVGYLRDHGAGVYEPQPERIAALVRRWFTEAPEEMASARAQAAALARPDAALTVARRVLELAEAARREKPAP